MKKILLGLLLCYNVYAADIWLNVNPVAGVSSNNTCLYAYTNLANYIKTPIGVWGWIEDTNSATHTVTDTNSSGTKIEYLGRLGSKGCSSSPLTVPVSTDKFRFTVFNAAPTGQPYWIKLEGFLP